VFSGFVVDVIRAAVSAVQGASGESSKDVP